MMTSSQVGKTEALLNAMGYYIDQDPCPILHSQPTVELADGFSKERLAPMLRDTACLKGKVADPRTRDSGNQIRHKQFPGGLLTIVGANSPASLAGRPVRVYLGDEVDRYPLSAGSEGDPVNLCRKRTQTYASQRLAKIVLTSTPTVKGRSRIEAAYEDSDQQKYHVPCPHCGEYQVLKWSQVQWDKDGDQHLPETTHYVCEHCGSVLREQDKHWMIHRGRWVADNPDHPVAGFWFNELYSPWSTWESMVRNFLEAKRMPETLKTFVNTSLAETFEEQGERPAQDIVLGRREPYGPDELPEGVLLLTAGVDIQQDRIEVCVWGWGQDEECWAIDPHVIQADPAGHEAWKLLDQFLSTQYTHALGAQFGVTRVGLDTGYHTLQAYRYAAGRYPKIMALKGANTEGAPLLSPPSRRNAERVHLYSIGVSTAKEALYGRLSIETPGPGYIHFPHTWTEELAAQMTAEQVVTRYRHGHPYKVWEKARSRNEALDMWVYGFVAMRALRPNWKALARGFEDKPDEPKPPPAPRAKRRRGNWVKQW